MWAICKKEFRQFFSNFTGYITVILFLLLNGLFLFVFSSFNIFDYGYATPENFFTLAPYVLLFLIPAITMRLFPDEWRSGTIETLLTKPMSTFHIVLGKFWAAFLVMCIALLPTLVYLLSIKMLAAEGTSLDTGSIIGSYTGLLLLSAAFTAVSLCCSSFTGNAVVAFLFSAFICFIVYSGFGAIALLPVFRSGADYIIEQLGMEFHYRSLAKGVIDSRDVIYFLSIITIALFISMKRVAAKK